MKIPKLFKIFSIVSKLESKVDSLEKEVFHLKRKIRVNSIKKLNIGDKVKVNDKAGFHKGAYGIVTDVLPEFWDEYDYMVLRTNAGASVYYYDFELDKINE